MKNIIFPHSLKKGDKIAIISPAGAVEEAQLSKTIELIISKGYEPIFSKNAFGKFDNGYNYSGTELQRLQDINWAFNHPEIKAIWASRGGYGCQHLLKKIKLSEFLKQPKWYIGYSDNTVIQSFLLNKGFASIHGQTIKTASFGITEESYQGIFDILEGQKPNYTLDNHPFNKNGEVSGQLVGGNLALIYALLATKYSYKFKDNILFIEDIGENFYALDRMLMALELAGVFRKIKGLIVGGMTNMGNEKENLNYENSFDDFAYEIISQRLKSYIFPVLFSFPNGHIFDNQPLVIGNTVNLKINENKATLNFL